MSSPSPALSSDTDTEPRPEQPTAKGKERQATVDDDTPPLSSDSAELSPGGWQAIFSPQHSAYYFYNASTGETTWINPLQPSPSSPSGTQSTAGDAQTDDPDGSLNPNSYDPNSLEARAIAAGIDPSLAYLDPSLAGASSLAHTGNFTAKFNARTGAFTAADARAPSHLSEYERMKRMSEFYFDVGAWEKEVDQRNAEEKEAGGKKRKRPTKKDLERFKEQKRLKKIAKTAWLRT